MKTQKKEENINATTPGEDKEIKPVRYRWQNLILITFILSILIFMIGLLMENSENLFNSTIRLFVDEKISATIQGTIGVAAAIAGAIVTISIANLAFDLAKASHEIAEASLDVSLRGPQRDAENEATRLRTLLIKFQYEFEDSLRKIIAASKLIEGNNKLIHLFGARFLIRKENLERLYRLDREDYNTDWKKLIPKEIEASKIILNILNAKSIIDKRDGMEEFFTKEEIEEFMENYCGAYAAAISLLYKKNTAQIEQSNFIQSSSINEEIKCNLAALMDAFKGLQKLLMEIYDHEELYPLIESIEGVSSAANFLKNRIIKSNIPETSDSWLDIIAASQVCLKHGPKHADLDSVAESIINEDEAKIYEDSRHLYFAFSLLENINSKEEYCHEIYFNHLWRDDILVSVTRFADILCASKDEILNKYDLVVKAKNRPDYIPRKIRNYAPSNSTIINRSSLDRALQFSDAWNKIINVKHGVPEKKKAGEGHQFELFKTQTNLMRKFAISVFGLTEDASNIYVNEVWKKM